MERYLLENWVRFGAVILAVVVSAACASAEVIYTQDFESSTPAVEYDRGEDADPAGAPFTQNVSEQKGWFIQVVSSNTTANLSPSGSPKIFGGLNSLKIDSNAKTSPPPGPKTPIYQIWPTTSEVLLGPPQSSLTFSFYGVPSTTEGSTTRLFEVWASEGGSAYPPVSFGGPFVYAFRFDQSGAVFHEAGGWMDSGITVAHEQWNTITITCDAAVTPDWVTLTVNGISYDNNGQGFGAGGDLETIGRYQFAGQMNSGVGSGIFLDDITIEDTAPALPSPNLTGVQVAGSSAFSFGTAGGTDYLLQFAKNPDKPFWRNTGCTIHGTGGTVIVTDPGGVNPDFVYRIIGE